MKILVALYGQNGHQIFHLLENHPDAELAAMAECDFTYSPLFNTDATIIKHYASLDQILRDERIDLVSICSPCRRDQAADTIRCLKAGKHVYAEKPCAMNEKDLDQIIYTAACCGLKFHEMAGTAFENPYLSMRQLIKDGILGDIIQIFVQKSYPYHDQRPQNNDVDGGLVMQVGIHAVRLIEHVGGMKVADVDVLTTRLGNPVPEGDLHMAASFMLKLENGGVASVVANYLNQTGFGSWSNEHLRIFGTKGFIESIDGGERTRMVLGDKDYGSIQLTRKGKDYFNYFLDELMGRNEMPLSLDDETHPLRIVIRANERDLHR